MNQLHLLLQRLESDVTHSELYQESVSSSEVAWHIDHSLLVITKIVNALRNSDPAIYTWSYKPMRWMVLTIRHIPRGRGKSPAAVRPKRAKTHNQLLLAIEDTRAILAHLDSLSSKHYFNHPYFGHLRLRQAVRFIEIHTEHHLSIIADIVQKSSVDSL